MNVQDYLDQMGVNYRLSRHDTTYTAQDLAAIEHIPGRRVIKPVIERADGHFVLCALPASHRIDLDTLRESWMAISPASYMSRFAEGRKKSLFVYTHYDTTFLPELSRDVVKSLSQYDMDYRAVALPCGHYTLGEAPFKFMDGYLICSFLKSNL